MGSHKLIIKPLRAHDIDNTVIVMEYYRDEANLPDGEYDSDVMLETIRNFVIDPTFSWFNMYEGNRVVGLVAGYIVQLPWSRKLIGHIQFIYTLPSHRNLTNAKDLVKTFEDWAINLGATQIDAGDIGIDPERTRVFYSQLGYKEKGCNLSKEMINE